MFFLYRSRKRRPSSGNLFQSLVTVNSGVGSGGDDVMDECAAAMVLMSLSCSPHSPHWDNGKKKKILVHFRFQCLLLLVIYLLCLPVNSFLLCSVFWRFLFVPPAYLPPLLVVWCVADWVSIKALSLFFQKVTWN